MTITKTRICLTIDTELWQKCQSLKEHYQINWSQVFEECVTQAIDIFEQQVGSTSDSTHREKSNYEKRRIMQNVAQHSVEGIYALIPSDDDDNAETLTVTE